MDIPRYPCSVLDFFLLFKHLTLQTVLQTYTGVGWGGRGEGVENLEGGNCYVNRAYSGAWAMWAEPLWITNIDCPPLKKNKIMKVKTPSPGRIPTTLTMNTYKTFLCFPFYIPPYKEKGLKGPKPGSIFSSGLISWGIVYKTVHGSLWSLHCL